MNDNLTWIITLAVLGGIFAFLWYRGHLLRLANYVQETKIELKKCTWPTRQELKESTVVVMISVALLGLFTMVTDLVITQVVQFINSI